MKYRCSNCKNEYEGQLLKCPHCGATLVYSDEVAPEVIRHEKVTHEKPLPSANAIVKGPVLAYNIIYLLALCIYMFAGLFMLFVPAFFLRGSTATQNPEFFGQVHSLYLKVFNDIAWMFRGKFYFDAFIDIPLVVSALVAIIVPIAPIVQTIKAMVKGNVTPYQDPLKNKTPRYDTQNHAYTMVSLAITILPELFVMSLLGARVFIGAYFYVTIYMFIFMVIAVMLLITKEILHSRLKVVEPQNS